MKKEKSLYLVPWIEVEYGWGERSEGYKVFNDLEECKKSTNKSSEEGNYESGGGYFGPVRPLCYYEVPFDKEIDKNVFVDHLPKFHSNINYFK